LRRSIDFIFQFMDKFSASNFLFYFFPVTVPPKFPSEQRLVFCFTQGDVHLRPVFAGSLSGCSGFYDVIFLSKGKDENCVRMQLTPL
jgi:hypothetical protein